MAAALPSGIAGCSSGPAAGAERTDRTAEAITWAPGPAMINRLVILGQLPTTVRTIADWAYFKNVPLISGQAPSMSLGLVLDDGLFYSQGFGRVGSQEPTPDTLYRIGSLTKLFTGAAMMKLLEQHPSMQLADPASVYYPPASQLVLPANRKGLTYPAGAPAECSSPCSAPVTLADLLTHSSGIPTKAVPWGLSKSEFDTYVQQLFTVHGETLDFYPGYNRNYSNANYEVLGRIIELQSHQSYDSYLQQYVLGPLGMTRTVFDWRDLSTPNLAPGFNEASNPQYTGQNVTYTLASPDIFGSEDPMWAAGGLYSTVGDMAKFIQMELSSKGGGTQTWPLTTTELVTSQTELLPNFLNGLPAVDANDPCVPCAALDEPSQLLKGQQTGASWWYGGTTPDSVLGNWRAMAGDVSGYGAPLDLAPAIGNPQLDPATGVGVILMLASNPDDDPAGKVFNVHDSDKFQMTNKLERDAAAALKNASPGSWKAQPLPSVVEGLMEVINDWNGSTQGVTQLFSPTFVTRMQGALPLAIASYGTNLGLCSTFTVQRISSAVSAYVTLQCARGTLPIEIASTASAPYQITAFQVLTSTASVPGTTGLQAGIAVVGGNGSVIPAATSNADGTWNSTDGGETSGSDKLFTVYATQGSTPLSGDFDGDGLPDLALTGGSGWNTIPVAFGNVDGTFHGTNSGVTSGYPLFTTVAAQGGAKPVPGDFDGDGYSDIALTGGFYWNTIPVAFSNGDGTFRATNYGMSGGDLGFPGYASSGAPPVWGDFNGDHKADIMLVGGGWGFLPIALSNGNGTFVGVQGTVVGTSAAAFLAATTQAGVRAVAGDFDGDSNWDVALVGAGSIYVALNQGGTGTFTASTCTVSGDTNFPVYATQPGARPVAGDFDGDGKSDIALTSGTLWRTMPIAFSRSSSQQCSLSGTNSGTSDGTGTTFAADAAQTGAIPVSMR